MRLSLVQPIGLTPFGLDLRDYFFYALWLVKAAGFLDKLFFCECLKDFFKVGIAHSKFKGNFLRGLVKRRIEDIQKSPAVFGSAGRNFFIKEAQARNLKNIQIFFCSQDFPPTPKREKKIGTRPKKSACRAGSPTL